MISTYSTIITVKKCPYFIKPDSILRYVYFRHNLRLSWAYGMFLAVRTPCVWQPYVNFVANCVASRFLDLRPVAIYRNQRSKNIIIVPNWKARSYKIVIYYIVYAWVYLRRAQRLFLQKTMWRLSFSLFYFVTSLASYSNVLLPCTRKDKFCITVQGLRTLLISFVYTIFFLPMLLPLRIVTILFSV